jgi:hypothetical protein
MIIVISTPTVKDYIEVVEWALYYKDVKWQCGSRDINEKYWDRYIHDTCIMVKNNIITYCNKSFIFDHYKQVDIISILQFYKDNKESRVKMFGNRFGLK